MQKKRFTERSLVSRLLFSRFAVTALLLIVQLALLFLVFLWLGEFAKYVLGGMTLLSAIILIYIINNRSNPAYKLAWILPIILLPVIGAFLYLYVQTNVGATKTKKILAGVLSETDQYSHTQKEVAQALEQENPAVARIASYIESAGGYPAYQNTKASYYPLGEDAFEEMKTQLETARKFIFMEYFIVEEGQFWDEILEILVRKSKEGVEVRFMYDDLGCLTLLPRGYDKTLRTKGLQARAFAPLMAFLSTHYNNRDHRKITVIDGRVAFNGGINLADEYINQKEVYGHWKDTSYMVQGDAVRSFTLMFLQMWNASINPQREDFSHYLEQTPQGQPVDQGEGFVIPYGDGPHQIENVAENVYIDLLSYAKKYVYIMSPYFIPDNELLQSMLHTAKSGVKVRLLLPEIPDKWFAIVIARSYYMELMDAGIEVYQYTPGFVHAKQVVVDDELAVVGTINLDFRSLYLHYECGGLFYKNPAVSHIVSDFEEAFSKSRRITREDYKNSKLIDRIAGRTLRIIAPLL